MLLWILWPVAQCSWQQFKDTPLEGVEHQNALDRDDTDESPERGFFPSLYDSASVCYDEQPVSSHPSWKRNLLYGLLILGLISALLHRVFLPRRPTGY